MSSLRRVRNLEMLARRIRPAAGSHEYDEDEWLVQFEAYYKNGHAADEPRLPDRAGLLSRGIGRGASPRVRSSRELLARGVGPSPSRAWRTTERYPDVSAGWDWLSEFVNRGAKVIPP